MSEAASPRSSTSRLRAITHLLLDGATSGEALAHAARELYETLSAMAVIGTEPARLLPTGRAISPADAARCTCDPIRTAMFLRGVADALATFGDARLEVVYAGTGPLAPLVLPLIACGCFANACITFIDIHASAVESVRRMVDGPHRFVAGDATSYRHEKPIDLLITETMQKALTVEPQVAIVRNLAPQLSACGVMVPELVRIDLCRGDEPLGTPLELTRDGDRGRTITITDGTGPLFYSTYIRTYGRHEIKPGESGLTIPEFIDPVGEGEVTFLYDVASQRLLPTAGTMMRNSSIRRAN